MKFSKIVSSVPFEARQRAQLRFTQLLSELATRKNNEFIGSGLGGNNFQLLVLMTLSHTLGHGTGISVKPDGIVWGENLLTTGTLKQIRYVLDAEFPNIREKHKYIAFLMDSLTKSEDFMTHYEENKDHFPKIDKAFSTGKYSKMVLSEIFGDIPIFGAVLLSDNNNIRYGTVFSCNITRDKEFGPYRTSVK